MITKDRIIRRLEKNVSALKLAYSDLLTTKQSEGKLMYGSVAEFKKVKENVRVQIYTLNTFLEWIYREENAFQEVPMWSEKNSK